MLTGNRVDMLRAVGPALLACQILGASGRLQTKAVDSAARVVRHSLGRGELGLGALSAPRVVLVGRSAPGHSFYVRPRRAGLRSFVRKGPLSQPWGAL